MKIQGKGLDWEELEVRVLLKWKKIKREQEERWWEGREWREVERIVKLLFAKDQEERIQLVLVISGMEDLVKEEQRSW